MKSLSEANFVAPYKFTGFTALSVERAITLFTSFLIEDLITFSAPKIFVFTHSLGLYSATTTYLRAAA